MLSQLFFMVKNSSVFVQIIMLLLLAFSTISWAIFFDRLIFFSKLGNNIKKFFRIYQRFPRYDFFIENLKDDFGLLNNIIEKLSLPRDKRQKLVEVETNLLIEKLSSGLNILSMITNISPFLGLLGTVWGIMSAFLEIGIKGEASLAVVAPGIAEALITTIFGLVVAIPASIFYNIFSRIARKRETEIINIYTILEDYLKR